MPVSHGDQLPLLDYCPANTHPLPGTARQRMMVGQAAGRVYRNALDSDLDLSLPGWQALVGIEVGAALFELLDACHILLDC